MSAFQNPYAVEIAPVCPLWLLSLPGAFSTRKDSSLKNVANSLTIRLSRFLLRVLRGLQPLLPRVTPPIKLIPILLTPCVYRLCSSALC